MPPDDSDATANDPCPAIDEPDEAAASDLISETNASIVDAATNAVLSPDVSAAIHEAARRNITGPGGIAGLTGRSTPAVTKAVDAALADAARNAVLSPDVSAAIHEAARRNITGLGGIASLTGRSTPAVTKAVDAALADAARNAVLSPDVSAAIHEAARRNITGPGGIAGLTGRSTPAVTKAVDAALADAARNAVLSPDVSEAFRLAARRGATRGLTTTDPAVLIALQREREPEIEVPADEPSLESAPEDRSVASEGEFSSEFAGPGSFFAAHELVINSFAELTQEVQRLAAANRKLTFVWRGQQDAGWGLHSSLYRRLMSRHGISTSPHLANPFVQRFPDEDDMLAAELAILDEAIEWRMSETSALELFARLQHQGGPSRLLDVTRNPLIAAWFAVEAGVADDSDARLFALGTGPVRTGVKKAPTDPPVISEVLAGSRYPFWSYDSREERAAAAWGTGSRRRIWIPPAYDARIAAQNAAFLLEGVPTLTRKNLRLFRNTSNRQWDAVDVAASMSIYARPVHPHKRPRPTTANLAPIFNFRIAASAKIEIREMLERTYGFTSALLYPDIQGMSNRLRSRSDWIRGRAD